MITVNMHEAKTRLSALVAMVEQQHEVIRICRNGKPVACIRAESAKRRQSREFQPALAPTHAEGDLTAPVTLEDWPVELR